VDIATVGGLVGGFALLIMAIFLGGSFGAYLDGPSMMIVIGGGFSATLVSVSLSRMLTMPQIVMQTVFAKPPDPVALIQQLVGLAEVARRDGILALENMTSDMEDEFIVRGISMAVDGTDPELIEQIMETELENIIERHDNGKSLFDLVGKYAPAFGMIGTLIGLVAMLSNMDDPSAIGAGMAAALLTTMYGAILANVLFLPLADKLAMRTNEEVLAKTVIIQGVMAIQSGDNPRNVESKLMTFLPPAQRVSSEADKAA
jgi:chemotaxis protein MotA